MVRRVGVLKDRTMHHYIIVSSQLRGKLVRRPAL